MVIAVPVVNFSLCTKQLQKNCAELNFLEVMAECDLCEAAKMPFDA